MPASELSEQIMVVDELTRGRVVFAAVPNGGHRAGRESVNLRRSGVQAGVPDLLIFDPPPARPGRVGTALEMKREGGRLRDVSPEQQAWMELLGTLGWETVVGFGAMDALGKLSALGYPVRLPSGARKV